jgi:Zn-dependent protease
MKGALQIAKLFGIPVRIHWTFSFLFVLVFFSARMEEGDWTYIAWSIVFILTIFFCVVLHEFGHALTARRFGVDTVDIILSPIGGIARLSRLPEKPFQEFQVAIAGPLVNIAIALVLLPVILFFFQEEFQFLLGALLNRQMETNSDSITSTQLFLPSIFLLNITLAVFNMFPAFPMDGGRIVRALLSIRLGRKKATRIASLMGQALAVVLMGIGLWQFNILTVFIGIFVFFTAYQEYRMVKMDSMLANHQVREVMHPIVTKIQVSDTLEAALDQFRRGTEQSILVFEEDQPIGVLPQKTLIEAIRNEQFDEPVSNFIRLKIVPVSEELNLKQLFELAHHHKIQAFPVENSEGQISGMVDINMINHFIYLQQKLEKRKGRRKEESRPI